MVYGSNPETMSWCAFNYTNQLTAIRSAAPEGVEIAITTWPSADPVKSDYLKPSQFFAITKDSTNPVSYTHLDVYKRQHKHHEEMGCICYENPGMGIYFIKDPDGYWLEIVPADK